MNLPAGFLFHFTPLLLAPSGDFVSKNGGMKPQGFASWRVSAASYGEAVLHVPKARFIYHIFPLRLAMKRLSLRFGMKHSPLRVEYEASR